MMNHTTWTWACHICGKTRPDEAISVFKRDESARINQPPGTMTRNIRYCNDDPRCTRLAPFQFLEANTHKQSDFKPGQSVMYVPMHAFGDIRHKDVEIGVVSSLSEHGDTVFVLFHGKRTSQGCNPDSLIPA
ncbi:MAG: hypothetical protein E6R03_11585 [Hyphomicrobiaceae bacterium]|nr:MAG: hypothetical protein E6R03_11585 [Hyphomicrobiaceae bacterium]